MVPSGQQIVHREAVCTPPSASNVLLVPYRSSVIYESISPILPTVAHYKPIACDVSDPLPLLAACLRWEFWGASPLPRQPLLECNEDGHADNGSDEKHCSHDVHRG